jgi:hypothetical protein
VTVTFEDGSSATRPDLEAWNTPTWTAYVDFMRAITPFGWARFHTNELPASSTAAVMRNAAIGNNKQWWVGMGRGWLGVSGAMKHGLREL